MLINPAKNVLVLGATGTLGRELVRQLLRSEEDIRITCASRCEYKQKQMQQELSGFRVYGYKEVDYRLCDIRNLESLREIKGGHDVIFHVAALKHVDVLEANPMECYRTNVLGTINVIKVAQEWNTPHVVFSSTDKAPMAVNVYGMCKALSEKLLFDANKGGHQPHFSVFRWGNIIGSRGSAFDQFIKQIQEGEVYLTSKEMTRFWLTIEDACSYMLNHYSVGPYNVAKIPPLKAAPLVMVIKALAALLRVKKYDIVEVGLRPGERLHEILSVDPLISSETYEQYSYIELKNLLKKALSL